MNNFRNFRNFRNCPCKQGVTNIIFTVFQTSWTVLEEKILKINPGNVEVRAQWLSEILLHLCEKARWLLLQDVFNEIHSCRHSPVSSLSTALEAVLNHRWPRFYRSQPSSWCLRERPPKDGKDSWRGLQEAYRQTTSEQQERMSSILSDFHSLKENQQPEIGILGHHSQVQQSSASLQPESGGLVQHNQF